MEPFEIDDGRARVVPTGDVAARISVIVPVYNTAPYLRQCLDALVGQTLAAIEIIVIDDGSTDGSSAIIDEYVCRDSRVRAVHKRNSGYGNSMNEGIALAKAPWIAICEPDDFVEPTMCEHLIAFADRFNCENASVDIVKASYRRIIADKSGNVRTEPGSLGNNIHPAHQPFTIDECPLLLIAHPCIWTALYRKAFLNEFGIRFLPIPGAGWADNPFFIETIVAARAIVWLDEAVYNYREFEDGSISHLKDWRIITQRWADMGTVLEKYDMEIPEVIEAHCCRGCAYLQMLSEDFPQSDELVAAARNMAATLNHDLICHSSIIPKEYKIAYARYIPTKKRISLAAGWTALHVRAFANRLFGQAG